MKELSSQARTLLEQYREQSEIDDQPERSVLERIEASTALRETAAGTETPRRAAGWVALGSLAAASVATLWVWTGRADLHTVAPRPVSNALDHAAERLESRVVLPPATDPQPAKAAGPSVLPPESPPSPNPPPPRGHAQTSQPETDVAPPEDSLRRELELLRRGREGLREGRLADAEASLRAHALSYPQGQLSEEREALLVVVRCTEGGRRTGRAAFELTHPHSHHLPAIRAACDPKKSTTAVTDGAGGGK